MAVKQQQVQLTQEQAKEQYDKLVALKKEFEENILAWGFLFIPEHFRDKPPEFHKELIAAVETYNELAVIAPRGSAKTTILSFLYPMHCIYNKKKHYIVLTGSTKEKASEHIAAIADQIKNNEALQQVYGKIDITRDSAQVLELEFDDGYKIRVQAFGAEQLGGKRGSKFRAYRPDLIILDDIDDDKLVESPDRRRELQRHIDDALFPMGDKNTQFIAVGTMLHFDCQIAKMVDKDQYKTWHKMFYKSVINDETQEVLWKECRTYEWLMNKKQHDPISFAKEYQNNPISGENMRFNPSMLRKWKDLGTGYALCDHDGNLKYKGVWTDCIPAISCDLAWSEKKTADETVILSAMLTPERDLIVFHYYHERGMRPQRLKTLLFNQAEMLQHLTGTRPAIGFEKAMLEKVQKSLLKDEMRKKNVFYSMKDLKWDTDKIKRIEVALESRYANGIVYHRHDMGELEEQLLRFPYAAHDDICFAKGTKISTPYGDKEIQDFKVGDKVITPFGIRKVVSCGCTGTSETIKLNNMRITPKHKVFTKKHCFVSADMLYSNKELSKLTLKEVFLWRYKKLLSIMEKSISLWEGRKSIILVSQIQIKDESVLKDFMLRFGSFIIKGQFLRAIAFIIKTMILLITVFLTLNVYHILNMLKLLKEILIKLRNILLKSVHLPLHGTNQKKEGNGIAKKLLNNFRNLLLYKKLVAFVQKNIRHTINGQDTVQKPVEIEQEQSVRTVYNLTVNEDCVYYANGVLVSNCDALQGVTQLLNYPKNRTSTNVIDDTVDEGFELLRNSLPAVKNKKKRNVGLFLFGKKSVPMFPATKSFLGSGNK